MKSLKLLPRSERYHFMKCECGEYFDMRDLKDVARHLHKNNALIEASASQSVNRDDLRIQQKTKRRSP